jgi:predicted NBD/HSP70 family sugar kinase
MVEAVIGGGPQRLRRLNCAAVLGAIREAGVARVTELVRTTGLSRPTVAAAVATLINDGWIEETDPSDLQLPRMGRPARLLRFRAEARHVLGVDVGPHKVQCAVADLNGTVVAQCRRDVADLRSGADLLAHVESAIDEVLARAQVTASRLIDVAVGTPGVVDERHGAIVQAPAVPGWHDVDIPGRLRDTVSCPVRVENDVNLAVMAERWLGAGNDVDSMVLVHWGTRIGAAVFLNGHLHRGAHGAAGEIGFVDVDAPPRSVLHAGGLGPFEATAGSAWIVNRARELGDTSSPDAATVLTAAASGDQRAVRVVDEACARFVRVLAAFLAAVDPELVVIGGAATLAGDVLLDSMRRHLEPRVLIAPRLGLSALGEDAVALGAVRLALGEAERHVIDMYARH